MNTGDIGKAASRRFSSSAQATIDFLASPSYAVFLSLVEQTHATLAAGNKLMFFGNGGSAAEATHLAAEFLGKCVDDVGPQAAIALNDSISAITAISNDWDFSEIFSRQVQALVKPGDLLIGMTTSGSSPNVLKALATGRAAGAHTSLWTSDKFAGNAADFDYVIKVPTTQTPRVQEVHLQIGHILSEVVAKMFLGHP